ncbi:hypothetical protein [Sinorhizobium fredii]|uniref:hypothetical protein n=1 Tax=Rhizobium fredii TaxID=380 RepID=UPI0004B8011A|nr:hypothetical protein [Sinorhizobium fredii]
MLEFHNFLLPGFRRSNHVPSTFVPFPWADLSAVRPVCSRDEQNVADNLSGEEVRFGEVKTPRND